MKPMLRALLAALRSSSGPTSNIQHWLLPLFRTRPGRRGFQSSTSTPKSTGPLRILFCGSDEFSCAHLRALHKEHVKNPGFIESIDVVVRPGKRFGRGNKLIKHPPLKDVAKELDLPVHERDTFIGWTPPTSINIIIAVSFGLFVPPRLLGAVAYGGLNVHPSLLPEFRGAAPLHHTLLSGRRFTGVTVQTLDHATFDAGVVLAQTPLEDAYRIPEDCDVPGLLGALSPLAAGMLVRSLRDGLHVPPHVSMDGVGWVGRRDRMLEEPSSSSLVPEKDGQTREMLSQLDANALAPKITPQMRRLFPSKRHGTPNVGDSGPSQWSAHDAARRHRLIGPLWFTVRDQEGRTLRVLIDGQAEVVKMTAESFASGYKSNLESGSESHQFYVSNDTNPEHKDDAIYFAEKDDGDGNNMMWNNAEAFGKEAGRIQVEDPEETDRTRYIRLLRIERLKVEGRTARPAREALGAESNQISDYTILDDPLPLSQQTS